MKKIAVIVAGGKGTRMNNDIPKQFMLLKGKPVLYYSIKAFLDAFSDIEIILVLPPEHMGKGLEIIDGYFPRSRFRLCEGGSSRFNSVKNGLGLIDDECIIFVHDGVRCLLTPGLVRRCFDAAAELGTAIPAIDSKDSLRLLTASGNKILNRNKVKIIQTPQTFHSKILLPAFNIDYKAKFTDEASVVEAYGLKLNIIDGEENNIKITTPFDIHLAENLLPE
ncbi:MAG: 2-C-methyl-D-erythritol 4-phosphate cytidylyltransferase [Ginsengibacter sp.]